MNLAQFIETYQGAITQAVLRTYPPVYTAWNRDQWGFDLGCLRRRPLGAQGDAIRAVAVSARRHQGANLVGEMGTGKTAIGTAAAYLAGFSACSSSTGSAVADGDVAAQEDGERERQEEC